MWEWQCIQMEETKSRLWWLILTDFYQWYLNLGSNTALDVYWCIAHDELFRDTGTVCQRIVAWNYSWQRETTMMAMIWSRSLLETDLEAQNPHLVTICTWWIVYFQVGLPKSNNDKNDNNNVRKNNDSAEHFEISGSDPETDKYFVQKLGTVKEVRFGLQNQPILVCVRTHVYPKKLVSLGLWACPLTMSTVIS